MREQSEKKKEKPEYAEWIIGVRKKCGYKQNEFGKIVCHFVKAKDGSVKCGGYGEKTLNNWENGKNPPSDMEAVVSLALLDYCGSYDSCPDIDYDERRRRHAHVQKCVRKRLGRSLYCRNLIDALFIAAAMGIYGVNELPEVLQELEPIIQSVELSTQEKTEHCLEEATEDIEKDILACENKEEIKRLVERWKKYLALGGRTVGERIMERYNTSENHIRGLQFKEAVAIYVPRVAVSYSRIFQSNLTMSREWLLDFCVHLRLSRREIEQVLKDARLEPLSKDKENMEAYLKANNYYSIGSVKWYEKRAEKENIGFEYRYPAFLEMPLKDRMYFLLLLAHFITQQEMQQLPPIDYLLEYAPWKMKLEQTWTSMVENPISKISHFIIDIDILSEEIYRTIGITESEESKATPAYKAYEEYKNEFVKYTHMCSDKYRDGTQRSEGDKLTCIAALSYSILTGKIYVGSLTKNDLRKLKELLKELPEQADEAYYFMTLFWEMFLGKGKVDWTPGKGFYLNDGSNYLDLKEVIENITEICEIIS